jgi:FLVCR family feline leukemia virus subgroup C receptor-related protein
MHQLFTFPAAYFIDIYGSRIGIKIGSILCLFGTCLRLLVNQGFVWVIIGQIIAGFGRPFILNCQAKISASWFKADTRGAVTQYLTLIMNVSLI